MKFIYLLIILNFLNCSSNNELLEERKKKLENDIKLLEYLKKEKIKEIKGFEIKLKEEQKKYKF